MGNFDSEWLRITLLTLPPLILSMAVHEVAHARTALAFGDPTARNQGRCSFNPLVHLDHMGLLMLIFGGFGWAKPVPVNPYNLHPRKWGDIAVSLAGPMSNFMIAIVVALIIRALLSFNVDFDGQYMHVLWRVLRYTISVNLLLAVFNMIPLYPLDGHHIFREQLPVDMQVPFMNWQMMYGRWLLIALFILPTFLSQGANTQYLDPIAWVSRHMTGFILKYVALPEGYSLVS